MSNKDREHAKAMAYDPQPSGITCDLWAVIVCEFDTFFGRVPSADYLRSARSGQRLGAVIVQECQYARTWGSNMRGFPDLASVGPNAQSNVTKPIPEWLIQDPRHILPATPEAIAAWKATPWSGRW